MTLKRSIWVLIGLAVLILSACNPLAGTQPTSCDGITSEVGGCDADRPSFTATTCDGLAVEFGKQLNDRLVPVFTGPSIVRGNARSAQIVHAESLVASLANLHLRQIGAPRTCDLDAFLSVAEGQFSDELKAKVGQFAYEGVLIITYERWLAELREIVGAIGEPTASPPLA